MGFLILPDSEFSAAFLDCCPVAIFQRNSNIFPDARLVSRRHAAAPTQVAAAGEARLLSNMKQKGCFPFNSGMVSTVQHHHYGRELRALSTQPEQRETFPGLCLSRRAFSTRYRIRMLFLKLPTARTGDIQNTCYRAADHSQKSISNETTNRVDVCPSALLNLTTSSTAYHWQM